MDDGGPETIIDSDGSKGDRNPVLLSDVVVVAVEAAAAAAAAEVVVVPVVFVLLS